MKNTIEELRAMWDVAILVSEEAYERKVSATYAADRATAREWDASVKYHNALDEENYQRKFAMYPGAEVKP